MKVKNIKVGKNGNITTQKTKTHWDLPSTDLIKATTGWSEGYHIGTPTKIRPEGGITHECVVSKSAEVYAVYWWDADRCNWQLGYRSQKLNKSITTCQGCGNMRPAGDDEYCRECAKPKSIYLPEQQYWIQKYNPPGSNWVDYIGMDPRTTIGEALADLQGTREAFKDTKFRLVVQTISVISE